MRKQATHSSHRPQGRGQRAAPALVGALWQLHCSDALWWMTAEPMPAALPWHCVRRPCGTCTWRRARSLPSAWRSTSDLAGEAAAEGTGWRVWIDQICHCTPPSVGTTIPTPHHHTNAAPPYQRRRAWAPPYQRACLTAVLGSPNRVPRCAALRTFARAGHPVLCFAPDCLTSAWGKPQSRTALRHARACPLCTSAKLRNWSDSGWRLPLTYAKAALHCESHRRPRAVPCSAGTFWTSCPCL